MKIKPIKSISITMFILLLCCLLCSCAKTVTFYDGGQQYDVRETEDGLISPPTPQKEGYTFGGWFTDVDLTSAFDSTKEVKDDINLYAKWTPTDYKITYEGTKSATNPNPTSYTITSSVQLEALSLEGYTFGGWFKGETQVYAIEAGTTGNVTLMANWSVVDYDISYDLNGGVASNSTQYTIESATFTLTNPTKAGYTFIGWTTSDSQTLIPTVSIPTGSTGNRSYIANWSSNPNRIVFNKSNPLATGEMSDQSINTADTAKLSQNTFILTGYSFIGWATSPNGAVVYDDAADYLMGVEPSYNLYAQWTPNVNTAYTVNYYLQNVNDDEYTLDASRTQNLTGTTDTQVSTIAKSIEHFTYDSTNSILSGQVAADGSLVLSIYYTRDSYIVTFTANGGMLSSGTEVQAVKFGANATAPTYTRLGYTFDAWSALFDQISGNLTVNAKWIANSDTAYTVNYYLQNLNNDEYTLDTSRTQNLTGTTDTIVYANTPEIAGYTYESSLSAPSGNVESDESRVLTVYYSCNKTFDGLKYQLIDGNAVLTECLAETINAVVANKVTIAGAEYDVLSIDVSAFADATSLKSLTIGPHIALVPFGLLENNTTIENLTLGDLGEKRDSPIYTSLGFIFGATNYGENASKVPFSLKKVTLTDETDVAANAFYGCSSLIEIIICCVTIDVRL